ncbi:MAG: SAM-dependent methyltransferase [Pseudomonadota bacterium]|nr:SAM-dependent methyltransferase [Pseudomonadota bacterium]
MANERLTENLVRDRLREFGYYQKTNDIRVEEQKSSIENIRRALVAASKSGGGGGGSPEFIITNPEQPDFVLIIECKADVKNHASPTTSIMIGSPPDETPEDRAKRVVRFAVDGALHYAQHLAKEYNVIAVAVSGQTPTDLRISTYLHTRGSSIAKPLMTKDGAFISDIIPWSDYTDHAIYDPSVQAVRHSDLMAFSRELHDFMRDDVKASENEKPLFVSGSLIALRNSVFAKTFGDHAAKELPDEWLRVIKSELRKAEIPNSKKETIALPYSNIASHPEIAKRHKKYPKGVLHELIKRLNEKVWPFISVYHDFDVVGQFYGEFLKYAGGDKKALGIVLTPRHITELCALLANVNKDSKVLDICAGTGGFLISAMHQMFKSAVTEREKERIKKESLIGIEQQPNMFALAASNMILRGDGKANLHQASCFEDSVTDQIKTLRCDVGLLNPPYSQGDEDLHELYFVGRMLDCLRRGGIGIAVVPMNCAISPHKARAELLKKHTLEAVMSLPDLLFTPVGAIPCLMVFTAKVPHATSNKKTWFGYWKDDGFIKTKHLGRIDSGRWSAIRDRWVETFRNREIVPGESVVRRVTADDEWCAEAYMETDYSTLTQSDFERVVRNYAVYRLIGASSTGTSEEEDDAESE